MAVRTMLTLDNISKSFDKSNYNFGTDLETKHFYLKCAMEINNPYDYQKFDCNIEFDFKPNISGVYPHVVLVNGDASGQYNNGFIFCDNRLVIITKEIRYLKSNYVNVVTFFDG